LLRLLETNDNNIWSCGRNWPNFVLIQRAEDGSPSNDKPCHYAGKSPKINTLTLVLLIKIYSIQPSIRAGTILDLLGTTVLGGTLQETGVRAHNKRRLTATLCSINPRQTPRVMSALLLLGDEHLQLCTGDYLRNILYTQSIQNRLIILDEQSISLFTLEG
jgi:hypothetical protein